MKIARNCLRSNHFSALVLLLLYIVPLCSCIYQDEVGKIDWHKRLIGKAKSIIPDATRHDIYYCSTEKNILASVNSTSGNIEWRKFFQNDKILFTKNIGNNLFTISGHNSQNFQLWNSKTGKLIWEASNNKPIGKYADAFIEKDRKNIVATTANDVFRFDLSTGELKWKTSLTTTTLSLGKVIVEKDHVYAIGDLSKPKTILLTNQLNLADGALIKTKEIAENQSLDSLNLAILHSHDSNSFIIWRDTENIVWFIHKLGIDNPDFVLFHAKLFHLELTPDDMIGSVLFSINIENLVPKIGFLYKSGSQGRLIVADLTDKNGNPHFEKSFDFNSNDPKFGRNRISISDDGFLSSLSMSKNNKFKYSVFDLSKKGKIVLNGQSILNDPENYGYLESIYKIGSKDSPKIFVQTVDGLACGIKSSSFSEKSVELTTSKPLWCRDEVLSSTTDQTFLDLNLATTSSEKTLFDENSSLNSNSLIYNSMFNYINRLYTHCNEFISFINQFISPSNDKLADSSHQISEVFGFGKLSIFVSRYGRITALDASNGNNIWSIQLNNLLKEASSTTLPSSLYLRTFKVFATKPVSNLNNPPTIVVAGRNRDKNTVIVTVNGLTGQIIDEQTTDLKYRATKVLETNILDSETEQKILLIVRKEVIKTEESKDNSETKNQDKSKKGNLKNEKSKKNEDKSNDSTTDNSKVNEKLFVEVWPRTKSAIAAISKFNGKLYIVMGDKKGSTELKGYILDSFSEVTDGEIEVHTSVPAREVWNMDFGVDEMQVIGTSYPSTDMRVSSIGRVLDSRKVLYKYLNPNTMIVLAGKTGQKTGLRSLIIDRVSGRVLKAVDHESAIVNDLANREPLVTMQDNWAAYYFWSQRSSSRSIKNEDENKKESLGESYGDYKLVSLEMFESNNADEQLTKENFSSYTKMDPFTYIETFILKNSVLSMGIASSRNGITTQGLVLGNKGSPLSIIPHLQINPRRNRQQIGTDNLADQKSDYLTEYEPVILESRENLLSYDLDIVGNSVIKTSATRLESTIVVLSYGVDVFCSKASPSGKFDVLSTQFSKVNLIATMSVLFIAGALSFPFVRRKVTREIWK
ncbi:ER membrane protein complex subunit 1 [Smittium culicis]|uniref:ER membrane protein complex subunit 1 n=1 Tax=Smittium culicis TaxID=133412 RepID=A0A1R1YPY1_9FUNG|nr:ER membrane protein complex subunit 1 [Smittium culicis]